MSYGTKYKLEWTDYFNQDAELLIQKYDYSDAITEIKGAGNPLSITYDTPSDNILDPINGSFATIRLISETDFQFVDLYTSDSRKYKVIFNLAGSLCWSGFMLPGQYQEEYKGVPYANEFIAADQLGLLKNILWDRDTVETELTTIGAILYKTDLDFDLWEGLNVYEINQNSTTSDSPLNQTYINTKAFEGLTYYDALSAILLKYAAIIKQDKGKWFIYRPEDAVDAFQRRLWTFSAGVFSYDSTESHDPIVSTTSASVARDDLVRISAQANMWINPAWRKYELTQNYGKIPNIIENGDFTGPWSVVGVTQIPDGWTKNGSFTVLGQHIGDSMRMFAHLTTTGSVSQTFYINHSLFKLNVRWAINLPVGYTMRNSFMLSMKTTNGYFYYYDFDNNAWTTSSKNYSRVYDNTSGANTMVNEDSLEIVTERFTAFQIEYVTFSLMRPVGDSTYNSLYTRWISASMEPLKYDQGAIFNYDTENVHDVEINPNNLNDGGQLEMLLSDVESGSNMGFVYKGGLWLDGSQLMTTESWTASGSTNSLVELLKSSISLLNGSPSQVLSASIYSNLLSSSSIIQEINNSYRLFMMRRTTWHPKYGLWETEAHQIGIGEGQALLNEDGTELEAEDGSTLLT